MITNEQVISIGKLTRTHGKRGEVQCLMSNEYWDNADATFLILSINNILVPFRVLDWRGKGSDSLIFQLDRINDEQSAQQLVGCQAYMLLSDINEDDELLPTWQSLVGYSVLDTDQGELGTITDVDETTINTLITLNNTQLIPLHEDFIIDIQQEKKQITICLPFIFTKE
ncbi:MAG: 16S rRNA processing protein RimM [Paludibacteraceae bacterium]|nr:16S rRNA processing protein RimM [Paludibacteraceae bacterium]MBR1995775.1 16S rRNA processing protein RimM [Paludibacteraceae bacterium]